MQNAYKTAVEHSLLTSVKSKLFSQLEQTCIYIKCIAKIYRANTHQSKAATSELINCSHDIPAAQLMIATTLSTRTMSVLHVSVLRSLPVTFSWQSL